jgi:hypothetical protein
MNARRGLLLWLGVGLSSCATTSGREWLEAPIEPRAVAAQDATAVLVTDDNVESRPRLRRTVTLGESYVAAPDPAAPVVGPAVQVNVTNNIPIVVNHPIGYGYSYGYGYASGYGYGYARSHAASVGAPVRATPSMPQQVGGDFPPPPDYGPRALR